MAGKKKVNGHHPKGPMRLYQSYMFRSKDPAIDELRTVVQDNFGKLSKKALRQIETDGGPTAGCMEGWFYGKVKRPQNATIEAAGRAMGMERRWVRANDRRK